MYFYASANSRGGVAERTLSQNYGRHFGQTRSLNRVAYRIERRPHINVSKNILGCPPVYLNQELEDIFNSPFSHWELECGIKQFPQRKIAGPDSILPEFLAHLGNEAVGVLLQLINLTWASGIPSMGRNHTYSLSWQESGRPC
ncbi:hypothetical protein TNCT_444771 [Trichonephila clavata]|uniref:Uncharacterized protein n=1 Tax=Trichonephila clavata TaxID=2740835 RepID=A0A8X6FFD1_TRICU|nr:hypothetical protein TNCT_444771 [Trichonephila clavata]